MHEIEHHAHAPSIESREPALHGELMPKDYASKSDVAVLDRMVSPEANLESADTNITVVAGSRAVSSKVVDRAARHHVATDKAPNITIFDLRPVQDGEQFRRIAEENGLTYSDRTLTAEDGPIGSMEPSTKSVTLGRGLASKPDGEDVLTITQALDGIQDTVPDPSLGQLAGALRLIGRDRPDRTGLDPKTAVRVHNELSMNNEGEAAQTRTAGIKLFRALPPVSKANQTEDAPEAASPSPDIEYIPVPRDPNVRVTADNLAAALAEQLPHREVPPKVVIVLGSTAVAGTVGKPSTEAAIAGTFRERSTKVIVTAAEPNQEFLRQVGGANFVTGSLPPLAGGEVERSYGTQETTTTSVSASYSSGINDGIGTDVVGTKQSANKGKSTGSGVTVSQSSSSRPNVPTSVTTALPSGVYAAYNSRGRHLGNFYAADGTPYDNPADKTSKPSGPAALAQAKRALRPNVNNSNPRMVEGIFVPLHTDPTSHARYTELVGEWRRTTGSSLGSAPKFNDPDMLEIAANRYRRDAGVQSVEAFVSWAHHTLPNDRMAVSLFQHMTRSGRPAEEIAARFDAIRTNFYGDASSDGSGVATRGLRSLLQRRR